MNQSLRNRLSVGLAILVSILIATPSHSVFAQDIAVKAKKIFTAAGEPIENGVVIVRDGKIAEVGVDLEIPLEMRVVESEDGVIVPGYVDAHNASGMSQANENNPVVPFLNVVDSIDPNQSYFEECRRNGVTTASVVPGNSCVIGGQTVIMKTAGSYVNDMLVSQLSGIKISLLPRNGSRMSHLATLRRELDKAVEAIEKETEEEEKSESAEAKDSSNADEDQEDGKDDEGKSDAKDNEEEDEDKQDAKQEDETKKAEEIGLTVMKQVVQGEIPVFIYCDRAQDIATALQLESKYNLDLIFVVAKECHLGFKMLKGIERPVILDSQLVFYEEDPDTRQESKIVLPRLMQELGIDFVFQTTASESFSTYGSSYLWYQAAAAMRYGLSEDDALRSLTILPAKAIGVDSMVGSIEVGKDADLVVLTGDPFQVDTWVQTTIVNGEIVYQRDEDTELELLLSAESE